MGLKTTRLQTFFENIIIVNGVHVDDVTTKTL